MIRGKAEQGRELEYLLLGSRHPREERTDVSHNRDSWEIVAFRVKNSINISRQIGLRNLTNFSLTHGSKMNFRAPERSFIIAMKST